MKPSFTLVTLGTAAKTLAVSVKTVRRMIDDGQLEACKIRSGLRISKASLDSYVKSQIEKFQLRDGIEENYGSELD